MGAVEPFFEFGKHVHTQFYESTYLFQVLGKSGVKGEARFKIILHNWVIVNNLFSPSILVVFNLLGSRTTSAIT